MPDVDFWSARYETQNTPWDLSGPSPHFVALLNDKPSFLTPGKMAVLGSGRGHDAAYFADAGFEVTGFDYAPQAVAMATKLYGGKVQFKVADIFDLASPGNPDAGQFDYVLEHTCFCAIDPERRTAYARSVETLLKPDGYLIGILWEHSNTDGPPFSTSKAEIETVFGQGFDCVSVTDCKAVDGRGGVERLVILRRKNEL